MNILDPKIYISKTMDEIIDFVSNSNMDLINLALTQVANLKKQMAIGDMSQFNR